MLKFDNWLSSVKNNLENSLPGKKIQYLMAPIGRESNYPNDKNYTESAVALLLYKKNDELFFPLIKRTSFNENDKHKGQISFPGGKLDTADHDLLHCAKRELNEEVGIDASYINLLGNLTDLYIPVSNFKVQPFVFYIENDFIFIPQESEVEYILEISVKDLLNEQNVKVGKITYGENSFISNVPYFQLSNHIVWGATAMILNEFKNVISKIKTN